MSGDTVLITGVAGFIGSHLSERLLSEGDTVVGLDNFDPYYDPARKRANLCGSLSHHGFTFHEADIRDAAALEAVFRAHRVDVVVHLAAKAGVRPSLLLPDAYVDVNLRGTVMLMEAMRMAGVSRMVFASSSSVYGNQEKIPFSETDPVDHPVSPYAATKRSGELLCSVYHTVYGFAIWSLRFFTVYGPRQRPEMAISRFLDAARSNRPITVYGDGSMERDFTYVDDIVQGVRNAVRNVSGLEIINIGGSHAHSLRSLTETIEAVTGRRLTIHTAPPPTGDVQRTLADTTRAERLLSFVPALPLAEGLRRQWEWMHDNHGDID